MRNSLLQKYMYRSGAEERESTTCTARRFCHLVTGIPPYPIVCCCYRATLVQVGALKNQLHVEPWEYHYTLREGKHAEKLSHSCANHEKILVVIIVTLLVVIDRAESSGGGLGGGGGGGSKGGGRGGGSKWGGGRGESAFLF